MKGPTARGLRLPVTALTTVLSLAAAWTPSRAQSSVDSTVVRLAERELRSYAASGAAIAVLRDGGMAVHPVGRTLHGGGEAVRAEQPFGTVGFGDILIAYAALLMDEAGQLDTNAPINTYASDLPPRVGAVTLDQLFSHTAGLDDADDTPTRRRPVSAVWPAATDQALFTEPGAIYSRSRIGLRLAHGIVEREAGEAASRLVERLVLSPAGMNRTTFDSAFAASLDAVPGLVVSRTSATPLHALTPATNPRAQMYATAGDLGALLASWLHGSRRPGSPSGPEGATARMIAPRAALPATMNDSVALGLNVSNFRGYRQLSYTAGEAGYGIIVRLVPGARAGVVILANATGAVLQRTADSLLASVVPHTAEPGTPPAVHPAPLPTDAADYAGTYANGDRIVVLELRDGELFWRDGDLLLPVRRDGARLHATVADGRSAQTFFWMRDAAGRSYVVVDERAFRRTDPGRQPFFWGETRTLEAAAKNGALRPSSTFSSSSRLPFCVLPSTRTTSAMPSVQ
jgi:CubicO group peptidase (beta-lactamase class C family)